jgi:peptide/nickel transport system permease protein
VLLVTGLSLLGEGLNETINPVLRKRRIEKVEFGSSDAALLAETVSE